jgi:hypothetical protein
MRKLWIVDICPDANGHWIIRIDDGSDNGDTSIEPIATVYELENAELIVARNNCEVHDPEFRDSQEIE